MSNELDKSLQNSGVVVCVKDNNKKVLFQNKECIELCGKYDFNICLKGCMEIYDQDKTQQWDTWGSRTYKIDICMSNILM